MPHEDFPRLKSFARLNGLRKPNEVASFYDCKFYPYLEPGLDPVFAVVGNGQVIVARPSKNPSKSIDKIAWWHVKDARPEDCICSLLTILKQDASLTSIAWTYDQATEDPQLCVTGQNACINVMDVKSKKLVTTLIGHGKDINDLAVSPCSPWILASASLDCSARIWSLDPRHRKQPCMVICAGEGHTEGLHCLAWHPSGKYLLTGGMDNVVNLWYLPDLEYTKTPKLIHYAHFSTSAVHSNIVDCLTWHNDLIISRCANSCVITVWLIEEFDSKKAPPSKAPTTHEFRPTRSAWGGSFEILFQLDTPNTTPIWTRFGLFQAASERTMIAIGNTESTILFWDLKAIQEHEEKKLGGIDSGNARLRVEYSVDDPFRPLRSHRTETIPRVSFLSRQIAWSAGGEYMVVAGDQGMIAVFGR